MCVLCSVYVTSVCVCQRVFVYVCVCMYMGLPVTVTAETTLNHGHNNNKNRLRLGEDHKLFHVTIFIPKGQQRMVSIRNGTAFAA